MSRKDAHFLSLGVQYYIVARSAVIAGQVPVCGSLFHHSLEMFFKARLSQKHSLAVLSQRPFGHNLSALWGAFKSEFPQVDLERFDEAVDGLDKFERLRYPDRILQEGAGILIGWGKGNAITAGKDLKPSPVYEIDVNDIDGLVAEIFEICSRNPLFFLGAMNEYARDALTRRNSFGERLLKPQP